MPNEPAAEVIIAQITLLMALPIALFLYSVYALAFKSKRGSNALREPLLILTVLSVYLTFSPNIFLLLQLEEKFLPCFYIFMRLRLPILALLFVSSCFAFRSRHPKLKRTGRESAELALFLAVVVFLLPFLPINEWTEEQNDLFTDTDSRIAELYLAAGTDLDKAQFDFYASLFAATLIENKNIRLSKKMIFHGADIHESRYPNPCVCSAADIGSREVLDLLVSYGLKVDLHSAVRLGDIEIIRERLKENPDLIDKEGYWGDTALVMAAYDGRLDVAKCLLDHGAAVDATGSFLYNTPLQIAMRKGHSDIAMLLLENAANPNGLDTAESQTALHYAAERNDLKMIEALITHGAIIDATSRWDGTPLEHAIYNDKSQAAGLLLKHGAVYDSTLFLRIAHKGDVEVCGALIKRGVDINQCNSRGDTALHIAVGNGFKEMTELLLAHSADVNTSNSAGDTPLHNAVLAQDVKIARLLLSNGADRSAKDKNGVTPQELALRFESAEVRALFSEGAKLDADAQKPTQ
jgi:ankyrin repeat protein